MTLPPCELPGGTECVLEWVARPCLSFLPSGVLSALILLGSSTVTVGCAARSGDPSCMLRPTLGAAQAIDTARGLAVLPLTIGRAAGEVAWLVVTESSARLHRVGEKRN